MNTLDVSKNVALTDLNCSYNQLSTLDVSKNTELEKLTCDHTVTIIGKENTKLN